MKTAINRFFTIPHLLLAFWLAGIAMVSAQMTETNLYVGRFLPVDYRFADAAMQGTLLKVDLGNMAIQKANDSDVRRFAEQIVKEHRQVADKLKNLATTYAATVADKPALAAQKMWDRMNRVAEPDFSKGYVAYMAQTLKTDVEYFEQVSPFLSNTALKSFAVETTALLREELKKAENLQNSFKTADAGKP